MAELNALGEVIFGQAGSYPIEDAAEMVEGNYRLVARETELPPIPTGEGEILNVELMLISPSGDLVKTFPAYTGGYRGNTGGMPGFLEDLSGSGDEVNASYRVIAPEEKLEITSTGVEYTFNGQQGYLLRLISPEYVLNAEGYPERGIGQEGNVGALAIHPNGGTPGSLGCIEISNEIDPETGKQYSLLFAEMFNGLPSEQRPLSVDIVAKDARSLHGRKLPPLGGAEQGTGVEYFKRIIGDLATAEKGRFELLAVNTAIPDIVIDPDRSVRRVDLYLLSPSGQIVHTFPARTGGWSAGIIPGLDGQDYSGPDDAANATYTIVDPQADVGTLNGKSWMPAGFRFPGVSDGFSVRTLSPEYIPYGWGVRSPNYENSINIHPDSSSGNYMDDGTSGCIGISNRTDPVTGLPYSLAFAEIWNAIPPEQRPDSLRTASSLEAAGVQPNNGDISLGTGEGEHSATAYSLAARVRNGGSEPQR